ncbi:MAG: hypothetical protein AB1609_18920 [Bacillota bacterium]
MPQPTCPRCGANLVCIWRGNAWRFGRHPGSLGRWVQAEEYTCIGCGAKVAVSDALAPEEQPATVTIHGGEEAEA